MQIDAQRIDQLITLYRDGLLEDTLPFWIDHCVDHQHGGFMFALDRNGRVSVRLKGNLWKGPFHLPRMQLVCWKLLEEMKAPVRSGKEKG